MFRVDARQLLCVSFVGAGVLLALTTVWRGEAPGEDVGRVTLAELRGGDTFITWTIESCDSLNGFVPNCPKRVGPCRKCQNSSGGKLVFGGAGEGWRVIAEYDCGVVVKGFCNGNNVCANTQPTDDRCQNLLLVEQQPVTRAK